MTIGICVIVGALLICVARKFDFILAFCIAACYLAKHILIGEKEEYGDE